MEYNSFDKKMLEMIDGLEAHISNAGPELVRHNPAVIFLNSFRNELLYNGLSEETANLITENIRVDIGPSQDPDTFERFEMFGIRFARVCVAFLKREDMGRLHPTIQLALFKNLKFSYNG